MTSSTSRTSDRASTASPFRQTTRDITALTSGLPLSITSTPRPIDQPTLSAKRMDWGAMRHYDRWKTSPV